MAKKRKKERVRSCCRRKKRMMMMEAVQQKSFSCCGRERFRSEDDNLDSAAKERERENDKCLDPQLWHACAGGMVQMPPVNSKVYYFPQATRSTCRGRAPSCSPPGVSRRSCSAASPALGSWMIRTPTRCLPRFASSLCGPTSRATPPTPTTALAPPPR
uniref:Uncharacterized protein n=1 Tax=Oryza brachyantha TaxID=4533 RepID=J3NDZ9_ORYBR